MKTLKKIKGFLSMALALAGFSGASAQILISGTDFNVNAAVQTEMATGIENIVYTGVMKGEITLGVGFAEDLDYEFNARKEPVSSHFHETPQYGITNNPIKLDSLDYLDDEVVGSGGDWSIVFSPARIKANKTMLQYKVGGLRANSTATVVIEYRSVVDPKLNKTCANGGRFEFKVAINADQANLLQGKDVKQIETGTSASYTDSKVAVGADGTVDIRINAVPHMSDDCHAFAISKIEVYGDLDPEIYSVDGNSVCAGEIANLKIKGTTYLGVDYQWYRDDSPIAGATSPNYSFETDPQPDEHKYKLEIICSEKTVAGTIKKTSFFSNDVTIETEKCCEIVVDGVSVPASRKVVFKDDFGEFDIANDPDGGTYKVWDYSDIANPKQLTKKTIYPFRYELDEAPLNCKFNGAAGPISDGEYCVAGVLTGYNGPYNGMAGANLQWAADLHGIKLNKGFHTDHSGTPEGCCLLINCKDQTGGQNIYERDITNLCQNRQLFFECYITIFTSSAMGVYNPVDVTVRLTEIGNETNFIEKRATQTLPNPVGNGTGDWVKISGEIFLEKNDAVKLEIVNNQNTDQNGNDLVLDDIIIKACAAPSLQAYYDVLTFDTDTLTCGGEGITVYAKPSEMLSNYFGGADKTRFLYQYSLTPDVKTSWKNCGDVTEELSKDVSGCSVFSEVEDGDVVYFRIIAGSEYTLGNTKESDYNADDPCASYTISEAIPCEINCPVCSEPADPVISAEGGMVNKAKKTVELCKGESTVLTTNDITGVDKNEDPYADYTITWHKETATSAALEMASPAVVAPELTVAWDDVTEDGVMYIVKVHDIFENEKGTTGCDKLDTIIVIANPVPEKTLDEVEPFCEGTLAANEAPTLTIDGYKLHWYEDADTTKATKEPSVIDKEAKEYEYFYVLEDSKTGCKGEVNLFSFTVNAVPEELEAPDTIEYVKGVASVDISEKAGVKPAEDNTLFWTESSAEGDDGSKTAPMHDITVEDKVGKKYYVYQKNEKTGCFGPKSEIVVIVNDSPKPTPKDTVVCVGKAIADLSSLVKKESKDYELLWYASASDAKEDGVTTPASLTEEQAATPGEYKFYVAQKNTVTEAISEKAVVTVTVVGVDKPEVEDIDYCTGDDAAPLNENVTLVADESKFTYQSGLEWFVNKNAVKDEPVVETNVINTTPVRYAVRQVYEIPSTGEICQGDTAGFTVKTTFIGLPAVNATVTYVSGDLKGNTFEKNLLQQKEGAVETTDESYSLVWYDAEKNKIGDGKTPPTPVSDPAMVEAGKDQTFTYYVKQTDGTCEGELTEVKVIISSTPMPIVKNINFCEDEEVISIETLAEVNDNKGTIDESLLRLVWVDSDADDAAELAAPPTLSSDIETDEMPVKTTKYYVKQAKKNEDGSESFSSASEIIVKVYAKAQLKDKASMPGPVCEKAVDLKEFWTVSNQVDIELEVYTLDNEKKENIVYKSGLYDVVASFTVPKPNTGSESAGVCASEPHDIDVRIDELTVPGIVGTETTCPNTSAEGLAVEFETNYEGNDIKYSWSEGIKAGSGKEDVSTEILEGVAGDKFDFTVEVTAGTCTKTSPKHTITLGDGPVVGSIKFTEAENTDLENGMEINVSSGKATLYTCGTMLTMDPTALENTEADFKWTVAGDGSPVGSSASAEVNPTEKTVYRVTYTNKCSTSVDITVIPVPLTVGGAIVGADICENESASIDAQIQCVEKPESIRWSRNGEAVSKYDGEGKLVFEPAKPEDSGEYTCVVTNRACVREIEPQTLLVKPYVKFAPEKEEYVVRRGETVNIINTITVPSDAVPAEITWTDNGKAVENSGKDYSVEVTKDMNLNVEMTEEGKYCPSDVDIVVKVDAVLQLAGEISDANMGEDGNYKMCLGETKTLVIDTTGTGKFVYPEKMSLTVTESQAGGSSRTLSKGTLNSDGKLEFKISPSTDATYSVSFVYREGEGEDEQEEELEIKITVLQKIEVKVPNGLEVCEGEEVEIALESVTPKGTVITWEDETIEGGKAEGETVVAKPTFSKPANGGHVSTYTYTAYASFDICETAEFPVKVKVNEPLTGELEDVTICENETARLDASSYKATSYIWTSDELETERSGQGITVTPKSTAVFKVSMERGGCKAEDELTVTVNPNPLILQVDSLSYRKIAVVVDATHNGKLTYRIDDGTESSFAEFDSLAYAPHVAYVTDEYGCSSSFDFMINAPLIIPNKWMSPNGDGETDRWEVPAISETYPDAKIVIYDRFGKKLIEYKGSDPGWDGVYNGQLMPTTDYWYEITVHEIDKVYTGHFTLLRR